EPPSTPERRASRLRAPYNRAVRRLELLPFDVTRAKAHQCITGARSEVERGSSQPGRPPATPVEYRLFGSRDAAGIDAGRCGGAGAGTLAPGGRGKGGRSTLSQGIVSGRGGYRLEDR